MHKPILLVWQHGDERLAPKLKRYITSYRPDLWRHADFINGNPKAAKLRIGHIETNLNRSYDPRDGLARSYEERRAQAVLAAIRSGGYRYVLDIHTSATPCGRFVITASLNDTVCEIVGLSPYARIAVMPQAIAHSSLNGQVPHAISIECNRDEARKRETVIEIIQLMDNLTTRAALQKIPREVYYVDGIIPNDLPIEADAANFVWSDASGGYPILHGINSYRKEGFQGFRAPRKETVIL